MPINLTCSCGQQQPVAPEMAGRAVACVGCGQSMRVPAMGVLAKPKEKLRRADAPRPKSQMARIAMAAVGVLIVILGGGGIWWSLSQERPERIAQNQEPEKPIEREHPLIERKRPDPDEPETPTRVIGPVTKEPPLRVIEPVRQADELPNPFLLPVKPKAKEPVPVIVEKKRANVMEPIKLVWKLKEGDTFFQELMVTQKPTFKVLGVPVALVLQYHIVSRFTVQKANEDGSLVVEQKVMSAKLVQTDDLTRPTVAGALAKMPGTTYRLHLNSRMNVTKFDGTIAAAKIGAMQFGGGAGVQMTSLLDRDGWKELAQATFFQMNEPKKPGTRWSKPMTHNWGALGSWGGQIHYVYGGQQKDLHKIAYGLNLTYQAPGQGNAGAMAINGARFQPPQAEGFIVFDVARGKVVAAEERFRVVGVISLNLLGQNTPVEINEDQHFLIRIHDKAKP